MHFYIIILIISLFNFLFCLHVVTKDDFLLLRKNITREKLFNLTFILAFVMLFFARVFYVIFNFNKSFLNPLVFLLFPYFPGLSFSGGLLLGIIFIWYFAKNKKMPLGKLFDFFMLSFLSCLPIAFLGLYILEGSQRIIFHLVLSVLFFLIFIFFMKFFLPRVGTSKDGSLGIYILFAISILQIIENLFFETRKISIHLNKDALVFIALVIFSLCLVIKRRFL